MVVSYVRCGILGTCAGVVVPRVEVAAAVKGAMVGDLDDPGARGAVRWLEEGCLAEDEDEDILYEILGFGFIAQDATGDVSDNARVAAKENSESFFCSLTYLFEQQFVRGLGDRDNRVDGTSGYFPLRLGLMRRIRGSFRAAARRPAHFRCAAQGIREIGGRL